MKIKLKVKNTEEYLELKPSKIIALGLNYKSHIEESHSVKVKGFTQEIPEEPVLFPKLPSCLIESEMNIIIPKFIENYNFKEPRVDYEAELAFIIKKRCKNVNEENAMDFIYGFTCFNDISQRNLQTGDRSGWWRGKSLDTFGPIGPIVVKTEDIENPQALDIKCRLNGQIVQNSNTKNMIFTIPKMLSFISMNFTLEEGDIISTGTPSGVGQVKHGDNVEVEIEKIGILKNSVIEESLQSK